jgi:bile acid:Na+ symporter, BASS family
MELLEKISKTITKLFPVWVVIIALIAFLAPDPFKPFASTIPYFLGIIMLGMGLTMSIDDFKLVLSRPKEVLCGVGLRYFIMPLVGYAVAKLLDLPPSLAAGLILVGCCPSGTASNVMTFLAKGDTALSVTVSSINTILAPLLTPYIFLLLAGTLLPINAEALLIDILKIVLLPIALGIGLRTIASGFVDSIMKIVPVVSVVAIIFVISVVVALNAAKLATVAGLVFLAVALHNAFGLLLGYSASRTIGLGQQQARAIAFEIGMENSGLAVALALVHLDPIAAIPGAIFSVWHNLTGSTLAGFWSSRSQKS